MLPDIDLEAVVWPEPWQPLTDEAEALAFGHIMNAEVADTVLGELQREICEGHSLYGLECRPIAHASEKEFLFLTPIPGRPLVLVHFTWHKESDPYYPSLLPYKSLADFMERHPYL